MFIRTYDDAPDGKNYLQLLNAAESLTMHKTGPDSKDTDEILSGFIGVLEYRGEKKDILKGAVYFNPGGAKWVYLSKIKDREESYNDWEIEKVKGSEGDPINSGDYVRFKNKRWEDGGEYYLAVKQKKLFYLEITTNKEADPDDDPTLWIITKAKESSSY